MLTVTHYCIVQYGFNIIKSVQYAHSMLIWLIIVLLIMFHNYNFLTGEMGRQGVLQILHFIRVCCNSDEYKIWLYCCNGYKSTSKTCMMIYLLTTGGSVWMVIYATPLHLILFRNNTTQGFYFDNLLWQESIFSATIEYKNQVIDILLSMSGQGSIQCVRTTLIQFA